MCKKYKSPLTGGNVYVVAAGASLTHKESIIYTGRPVKIKNKYAELWHE